MVVRFLALLVFLSPAPSMASGAVISRESPALGRIEGGKSVQYSLQVPANSLVCLRTDAFQADLHFSLRDPAGKLVAEVRSLRNLNGVYSLTAAPDGEGEFIVEVSDDQPPSTWAAFEIRLIELRPKTASDAHRVEAEHLLNRTIDAASTSQPVAELTAAALGACGDDPDILCQERAIFVAGLVFMHGNRFKEADAAMSRALELQTHDEYLDAAGLNWLVLVKSKEGALSGAFQVADKAVEASEKAHSPFLQAAAHSHRAASRRLVGEDSEVIAEMEEAIRIAESGGLDSIAVETRIGLAQMLLAHGDPRAEELLKAALSTARVYSLIVHQAYALNTLSTIRYRAGDLQGALDYATQATPLYSSGTDPVGESANMYSIAGIYWLLGDPVKSAAFLDRARAVSQASGDKDGEARALVDYANLKARSNDIAGSLALYREALDLSRRIPNKVTEALALEGMGQQLAKSGDLKGAAQSLSDALAIHRQMKDLFQQARTLRLMGGLARTGKDNNAALENFRTALQVE